MQTILMIAEAVGEALGSVVAAVLFCCLLWRVFRTLRHPEWAGVAVLVVPALALTGRLPHSEFMDMALAFAAIGAIPLWSLGRAWRREQPHDPNRLHRSVPR